MLDFKGKRILVIGDAMEDVFIYGNYTRKSPEADCQVFEIEKQVVSPGGAANAARNIEALGGTVDLVTCCEGITKTRVIVGNQHLVRIDTKGSLCANKQVNLRNYLDYCDAILISDYGKGTFTLLKDQLQDIASDCQLPIVVDPKEKDFSVYGNVTVITPNFKESQEATNLGGQTILIKEGRQGMLLYDTKTVGPFRGCPIRIPGHNVCTKEVAGAGDTVSAILALMLACGYSLVLAAHVSNVAGALSVSKEGVSTISIQELNEACVKWGVIEDKTKKPKIGFCNGCFDLFHPGHMWFLWQAAQQCDKLVVGLNTDSSVAKLKGENRPKQPFAIRKQVIQSLHFIEGVVLVEDPDEYLIEKKRFGSVPDIVFRGPDQKAPPEGFNWIRICPPIPIAQFSTTSQLKK